MIASLRVLICDAYSTWCMPTAIRPYKQLSWWMVTNGLIRVLFSYPKLFATFPVLARSDFRLSWHTSPTVISTRRYSIFKERYFVGAVIKYAEYIMGVVFKLRMIALSPQLVANKKALKGQDFWKFLKDFYNIPHLSKGKNRSADHLKLRSFTVCLQNLFS